MESNGNLNTLIIAYDFKSGEQIKTLACGKLFLQKMLLQICNIAAEHLPTFDFASTAIDTAEDSSGAYMIQALSFVCTIHNNTNEDVENRRNSSKKDLISIGVLTLIHPKIS
jgi:sialic acid synthase SpsE